MSFQRDFLYTEELETLIKQGFDYGEPWVDFFSLLIILAHATTVEPEKAISNAGYAANVLRYGLSDIIINTVFFC